MMNTDTTHNGWANYETWAVGMYLDGNYTGEQTYRECLQVVKDTIADDVDQTNITAGVWTQDEAERFAVEDQLKTWFTDSLPDIDGIAGDLLRAACDEINWRELAAHKIAEVRES